MVTALDVIGITETWLSEVDDNNEFSLPGFQAIHIERKLTKSSGSRTRSVDF